MRRFVRFRFAIPLALMLAGPAAHAEGRLGVLDAWIRANPDDAQSYSGYATLKNTGDAQVTVLTVQSDMFRQSSILDAVKERGGARLRELPRVDIAPGKTIPLRPGGAHIQFSYPREEVLIGEKIGVVFLLADGRRVQTYFDVVARESASGD